MSSAATSSSSPPLSITTFVVYAAQSVTLGAGDHSVGGDIGVATAAGASPQLTVGSQDQLDLAHTSFAPAISVGNLAQVGAVDTNALTNNGGQVGQQGAYPTSMPSMPTVLSATPGSMNVTVAQGAQQAISPGSYGALTDNGILFLNPGTYSFSSITLGNHAQLQARPGGSTNILVSGGVSIGTFCQIFPIGQEANALTISVAGGDGPGGAPPAVTLGANSQIIGLVAAPNGSLSFGNSTQATGAFAGLNVTAGTNVNLIFQNGIPSQAPSISTFVVYAERSISLSTSVQSQGGDLGVGATAPAAFGSQLNVGGSDILDDERTLYAPTVLLAAGARVGDIESKSLTQSGAAYRSLFPYVPSAMPPLPLVVAGAPSTSDITVASGPAQTLSPGQYGNLVDNGILNLQPGAYSFASVTLGNNAQLFALSGGATEVLIAGALRTGQQAQILPLGQQAGALQVYVSGADGPSGSPPAAAIGANNQLTALLAAAHGTVSLGNWTTLNGAVAGFDVSVGSNCIMNFQTGFPPVGAGPHGSQQLSGYYGNPSDGSFPVAGGISPSLTMELDVGLPVRNLADFNAYLAAVSDPMNANYGNYISRTTFAQTYAETPTTYNQLTSWAQGAGLTVVSTYPDNLMLSVKGTVAQVEAALFVNLVFRTRADGTSFVSVDREPSINLAPTVLWIGGLDDYIRATPAAGPSCGNPPNPANPSPAAWSINPTPGPALNAAGMPIIAATNYWATDIRNAYLGGSACQTLTGQNQVIGLLELDTPCLNDITLYDTQNPPFAPPLPAGVSLNASNVTFATGGPASCPTSGFVESTLDIVAAQAMAPGASVVVFAGNQDTTLGIPNEHADGLLKQMSGNTTLSTASNSWNFDGDNNEEQDINIMAGFGVSYFTASGDYGNIGDPGDDRQLEGQTLVGGTFVSTNSGAGPYYRTEYTWNQGCAGKDVTGGGIMNGQPVFANFPGAPGPSDCFPACKPVTRPGYQSQIPTTAISSGGNGASTLNRNYPDVAMMAANVALFLGGSPSGAAGTSAAAPLWAGFMALEREQAAKNGVGPRGYLNLVLYAIGGTKGSAGAGDLYAFSFHDVADGVTNLPPPNTAQGFPSVAGYDLATGWGSPTCGLIQQLASFNPLIPATYDHIFIHVVSGHEGLNDGDGASLDLYTDATTLQHSYRLKSKGQPGWHDFGQVHDSSFQIQDANNNPVRLTGDGIDHFVLNLDQPDCSFPQICTGDNWDVAALGVFLANLGTSASPGASSYACELDLRSNQTCQIPNAAGGNGCTQSAIDCGDQQPDVVRMSASPGCSGAGGSQSFPAGKSAAPVVGGCDFGGQPTGSAEPFTELEFAFATQDSGLTGFGTAGLRSDSELDVDILDSTGNSILGQTTVIKVGGSSDFAINEDTEEGFIPSNLDTAIVNFGGGAGLFLSDFASIRISVVSHNGTFETNDSWGVNGVYVWGLGGSPTPTGARSYTCLYAASPGEPEFQVTDGSPMVLAKQANCPF